MLRQLAAASKLSSSRKFQVELISGLGVMRGPDVGVLREKIVSSWKGMAPWHATFNFSASIIAIRRRAIDFVAVD